MITLAQYDNLKIPSYALPYLVNGDASGLEDTDQLAIDSFMARFYNHARMENGHVCFVCGDEEPLFTSYPAFGLAVDCVECQILIFKN